MEWINDLKFDEQGLIPAIIQDADDGEVLMMAWMNKESIKDSLQTGKTHFWSRSRQKRWMKGETSGNVQQIKGCYFDCDRDVLLFKVKQIGEAACHMGYRSCFYTQAEGDTTKVVGKKIFDPKEVYGEK